MLTINIMKLEVNTISNIGSLNIGKSIICHNRAVAKEISSTGDSASPEATATTPTPIIQAVPTVPHAIIPPIP